MFLKIFKIISADKKTAVIIAVFSLTVSFLQLVQPKIISSITDNVIKSDSFACDAIVLVVTFMLVASLSSILTYEGSKFLENASLKIRSGAASKVLFEGVRLFKSRTAVGVASSVVNDSRLVAQGAYTFISSLPQAVATCMISAVFCCFLMPFPFVVSIMCSGFAAFLTAMIGKKVKKQRILVQKILESTYNETASVFHAAGMIHHYGTEKFYADRLKNSMKKLYAVSMRMSYLQAVTGPLIELFLKGSFIVAMALSAVQVAEKQADFSAFVAFVMYFQVATSGLQNILQAYVSIQEASAGQKRIDGLTSCRRQIKKNVKSISAESKEIVEFDNVSFSYGGNNVLKNVTFSVPAKGVTAIVGASGAGKTTILNLLIGCLQSDSGDISFKSSKNKPVKIGYMDQKSTLIRGTVYENIVFGRTDISKDMVTSALDMSGLHNFTDEEHLNLMLGETDRVLSGGERQRIALARALADKSDLLVLDEPTSNADGILESALLESVKQYSESVPVILVAHRPKTIAAADYLIHLHEGMVVSQGTIQKAVENSKTTRDFLKDWN